MSKTAWKRLLLVSILGLSTAGTVAGLAVVLSRSRSHSQDQLRVAVRQRAGLTADLVGAMLAGPLTAERSSGTTDRADTVTVGPAGVPVGGHPGLTQASAQRLIAAPAVRRALVGGHPQVSNLIPAGAGQPSGFLVVRPTPNRALVTATLVPLAAAGPTLESYLTSVSHIDGHAGAADTYLLDANGTVVASDTQAVATGRRLPAGSLATALAGDSRSGEYGASRYFTAAAVSGAPWRVVYTVPIGYLDAASGYQWGLSFILLACFAAIAAICLALLTRLLTRTTQLGRANQALADRNQELQAATEAKSRFVANLSHELRNPLNAVIGFAELMHTGRGGRLADRQREHLGIIRGSARHLLALIEDALDLARIEAGHVRLEPQPVEPSVVAAECVNSLVTQCAAKAIEVEVDPRPVGEVTVDPDRLRQVMLNYLSNAIKFTPAGGRVTLVTRREHGRLRVEVSDSGPGIAPADREHIFEEFVQLEGRDRSGSGLGLAVTKLIVEAQGGEVGVRSILGEGSTFYAWIPAPTPARGAPGRRSSSGPRPARPSEGRPSTVGSDADERATQTQTVGSHADNRGAETETAGRPAHLTRS